MNRTVILVEGMSDKAAIEALAERQRRDLGVDGVSVIAMGGAQAIGRYLTEYAAQATVAGLCDEGEVPEFRRGLELAGFGSNLTREDMERLGFFVCVADLEDELIRAIGPTGIEAIAAEQGDLTAFRTLQKQAAWNGRSTHEQLRRWMGSGGRRKVRYPPLIIERLDDATIPRPLTGLLDHI